MKYLMGTKEAAKKIGVMPGTLLQAVWNGRIKTPRKLGRSFVWDDEDVKAAKAIFVNGAGNE